MQHFTGIYPSVHDFMSECQIVQSKNLLKTLLENTAHILDTSSFYQIVNNNYITNKYPYIFF